MNHNWKNQHPQYTQGTLSDSDAPASPWTLWSDWQSDAARVMKYTNEIVISTCGVVSENGGRGEWQPTARMVLLKYCDERAGFCWYSKAGSEKGMHIAGNPRVELLWYVRDLQRQVRVRGVVHTGSVKDAVAYAAERPRESQISALVSRQSTVVASREIMERAVSAAREKYKDADIPPEDDWTEYRLNPERFEFWQGRANRLHDRIVYTRVDTFDSGSVWKISRLWP